MENAITEAPISQRQGTVTLDSWEDVLFLVREPDRNGHPAFNVRLIFGTLPPWRYGTFATEKEAREAFAALSKVVEADVWDLSVEVGNKVGVGAHEEY
jgi:hypothetical protein